MRFKASSWALWAKGDESVFGVTMSLEVKYRRPVPYGEELTYEKLRQVDCMFKVSLNSTAGFKAPSVRYALRL